MTWIDPIEGNPGCGLIGFGLQRQRPAATACKGGVLEAKHGIGR
jgi:hypothetical protein